MIQMKEFIMATRKNSVVFSPGHIGRIQLKNRLVRSATFENAVNIDGKVTDELIEIYRALGRGGVGLIITGAACVYPKALTPLSILRIYNDSFIPDLIRISRAVHEAESDCRVMIQLTHPGRQVWHPETMPKFLPYLPQALISHIQKHPEVAQSQGHSPYGVEPTAPSPVLDTLLGATPRALALQEIDEIIEAYSEAIRRAQEAGFDGAEYNFTQHTAIC
jgi:2,4-dienoyl-CoA reductase-like NADH-dependent reductase (Old Yellow Enzyme family)